MHFGTCTPVAARMPDGIVFAHRRRHYPEHGQLRELPAWLRGRLEDAGFRVLNGRWQA